MKYKDIKRFAERCYAHPDHQMRIVTSDMIKERLCEEIEELRAYIDAELAQPEQEPVAWLEHGGWGDLFVSTERKGSFPVWKSPPSKPWVSLTDEERRHYNNRLSGSGVAEEIEAKLKEKNL